MSAGRGLCQPAAVANANPTFPQRALLCEPLDAVESFFLAGPVKKKQKIHSLNEIQDSCGKTLKKVQNLAGRPVILAILIHLPSRKRISEFHSRNGRWISFALFGRSRGEIMLSQQCFSTGFLEFVYAMDFLSSVLLARRRLFWRALQGLQAH